MDPACSVKSSSPEKRSSAPETHDADYVKAMATSCVWIRSGVTRFALLLRKMNLDDRLEHRSAASGVELGNFGPRRGEAHTEAEASAMP